MAVGYAFDIQMHARETVQFIRSKRAGVLLPQEFADLTAAYDLLRRLVNALRMLRGNAHRLLLPLVALNELLHLAHRMNAEGDMNTTAQLVE